MARALQTKDMPLLYSSFAQLLDNRIVYTAGSCLTAGDFLTCRLTVSHSRNSQYLANILASYY
jgi:hypothetical protein